MAKIGIDLGTTNSLAVTYREGEVELIPNQFGEYLTPSVVHVAKNQLTVGKIAKERLVTDPTNTAQLFKRAMGTQETFFLDGRQFSAIDLSSLVVKQLVDDAERYLGDKVDEVLISVPAYFNDKQRGATKAIGRQLGITVDRLINEPSAAAIACHEHDEDEIFIVFDFGGGTLDVSVVDCFDNVISIVSIAGDNFLGGSDFDKAIALHFCQSQNLTFDTLDQQQQASLLLAAERCKLKLQTEASASVSLTYKGQYLMKQYGQEEVGQIIQPVLERVKKVIANAVRESGYTAQDLDAFILVGGSSMMPMVQNYITKLLNLPIKQLKDRDELVARGLGTYLGIKEREDSVKNLVVTDICPFSLGVDCYMEKFGKDVFDKIIPKNSVLPTSATKRYTVMDLGQSKVRFAIYQGESLNLASNFFLDDITIDVPINYKYRESITVTFSYDINSLLYIETIVDSTGERQIFRMGHGSGLEAIKESQHLENIKLVSGQLKFENDYQSQLERANRLLAEMPYELQANFISKLSFFIKSYDLAINNLKKRQEIIQQFTLLLDAYEDHLSFENLDIFRTLSDERDQGDDNDPKEPLNWSGHRWR